MASQIGYIVEDGTTTMPLAIKNPTFQLTGATWGGGTVTVSANGVAITGATYTAAMSVPIQFLSERPVTLSFEMADSTTPNVSYAVW